MDKAAGWLSLQTCPFAFTLPLVPANLPWQSVEDLVGKAALSMIQLTLLAVALLHWAACCFYYVASWYSFNSNTWVYRQDLVPNTDTGLAHGASNAAR